MSCKKRELNFAESSEQECNWKWMALHCDNMGKSQLFDSFV